jgi:hypothetical protein
MPHNAEQITQNTSSRSPNHGLQIFGHHAKNKILLTLAQRGALNGRQLAIAAGTHRAHTSAILREFCRMGVLKRQQGARSKVEFDEDFFAFPELITLVNALGGRRVLAVRDPSCANPPPAAALTKLFGTPDRTRALVGLAAAESANIHRLSTIAAISPRATREVVRHFESQGIIRSRHAGIERIVEFETEFAFHDLLLALLLRLGDAFETQVQAARYHRDRAHQRGLELRTAPQSDFRPGLMPLGDPVQAHVLFELGRHGPLVTSALAKLTGKSMNSVRSAAISLQSYQLTVQRTYGKGHVKKRWIALNPMHPLTEPIGAYARDLFPGEPPPLRMPPDGFPDSCATAAIRSALPGHRLRLATLLAIFASGSIEVPAIARSARERSHKAIRRWVEDLHAHELVDFGPVGARMIAAPNPRFRAASSLETLVAEMRRFVD